MATPIVNGKIVRAIVSFVIILAVIVGGVVAISNVTPNQLGLGSIEIQGRTLSELGLADYKIKDIFEALKSLTADPSSLVENPVDETSTANAEQALSGSSLDTDGTIDYGSIYDSKVVYNESVEIEYQDDEIGAIVNSCLQRNMQNASLIDDDIVLVSTEMPSTFLMEDEGIATDLTISIEETTITVDDKINFRIVISFDLSSLTEDPQVAATLNQLRQSGINLPDPLVISIVSNIEVLYDETAKTVSLGTNGTYLVQGNQFITSTIVSIMGDSGENIEDLAVNQVGNLFCRIINNLGKVESIQNGKITVSTYTAADL